MTLHMNAEQIYSCHVFLAVAFLLLTIVFVTIESLRRRR